MFDLSPKGRYNKRKMEVQAMEVTVTQMKQIEHDADAASLSYTQMMEKPARQLLRYS